MKNATRIALATVALIPVSSAYAVTQFDQDVTNEIIFGDGNANGSFTTDRANGVELGLRGKLRYNAAGSPENTFNSNGDGTYTFQAGIAPTQTNRAVWSYEWSINTNYDGSSSYNLDDLTYKLTMTSTNAAELPEFDPINQLLKDHGIGTNSTANGVGDDDKATRT
ncbi:MAG: PEP-CTERM sorting domain-containing protein, partial [Phycisphaeraceae bacterium]